MDSVTMWAPDDYPAAEAAWRAGWGDLPYAACRRPVPAMVQLGVVSHAPWERLRDLVDAGGRAGVTWGPDVLAAVRRLLGRASTPDGLARAQTTWLQPLERTLLNDGTVTITRERLLDLLLTGPS
jgi:hypothetical protein